MRSLSWPSSTVLLLLLTACMTPAQPDGSATSGIVGRVVDGVAAACSFKVEVETVASLVALFGGPTAAVGPIVEAVCAQVDKTRTGFQDPSGGYGAVRGVPIRGRFLG